MHASQNLEEFAAQRSCVQRGNSEACETYKTLLRYMLQNFHIVGFC